MSKVYVIFAEGFEEIEGLTVVDVLRRAGIEVQMTGLDTDGKVTGAHGIGVWMDQDLSGVDLEDAAAIILPGGMPGTKHLAESDRLAEILRQANEKQLCLGAICAAPSVLGGLGILEGKKAACYPGFEEKLTGAHVLFLPVVTDGNITTSRGMGTALEFALQLTAILKGARVVRKVADDILYQEE